MSQTTTEALIESIAASLEKIVKLLEERNRRDALEEAQKAANGVLDAGGSVEEARLTFDSVASQGTSEA